LVQGL
jgi:hypothetical protein